MEILFLLVPLALILAAGGVVAFVWASRSGQFEDSSTPAVRILWDDPESEQDSVTREDEDSQG